MTDQPQRAGCLFVFLRLLGLERLFGKATGQPTLPYRLRDGLLSAGELAFYQVLVRAVPPEYVINCKVRIWDILYVERSENSRGHENRISSKHVDFLLCDRTTMKAVLAIELDDASHNRPDRQDRDAFVDQAFAAAGLPIIHIKAARSYSTVEIQQQIATALSQTQSAPTAPPPLPLAANVPSCPKCNVAMVQRKASKGVHAGKNFWACTNYPSCREIMPI